MLFKRAIFIGIFLLSLSLLSLQACSPTIFTGDKKSDFKGKDSGRYNSQCLSMNLATEYLDPQTARNLVRCLNSDQSMQALEDIVNTLDDEELGVVTGFISKELIANRVNAREVELTLDHFHEAGLTEGFYNRFDRFVSNEKLLNGITSVASTLLSSQDSGSADPDAIKALHLLIKEMSVNGKFKKNLATFFEFIEKTSNTKSATEIGKALGLGLLAKKNDFNTLASGAYDFINHKSSDKYATGKLLLWGLADESLYLAVNNYLGLPSLVHERVYAFNQIVRLLNLENVNGANEKLTRIFSVLDDPIRCFESTKEIPNGSVYVMNRFASWNALDVPDVEIPAELFKLKVAGSFCELPKGFNDLLGLVKTMVDYTDELPDGRKIEKLPLMTSTNIVKAIESADMLPVKSKRMMEAAKDLSKYLTTGKGTYPFNERYRRLLVQLLGDRSASGAYEKLSDVVAEYVHPERNVIANLMYLIHAVEADETKFSNDERNMRMVLSDGAYVLVMPRPELSGKSIYDVLISKIGKIERNAFIELVEGLSDAFKMKEDGLSLSNLVFNALFVNDSAVFTRMITDLIEDMASDRKKSDVIVRILTKSEFKRNLVLFRNMSGTGSFREFSRGILSFLIGNRYKNSANFSKLSFPNMSTIGSSVDLSTSDVWTWTGSTGRKAGSQTSCYLLDYDSSLFDPGSDIWHEQMKTAASCMNVTKGYDEFAKFMEYGSSPFAPKVNGKEPFLSFMMNYFKGFMGRADLSSSPYNKQKAFDELGDYFFSNKAESDVRTFGKVLNGIYRKNTLGTGPAQIFYRMLGGLNAAELDAMTELNRFTGRFMLDETLKAPDYDIQRSITVFYNAIKSMGNDETLVRPRSVPAITDAYAYPESMVKDYLSSSTPDRTVKKYDSYGVVMAKLEPIRKRLQDRPHELKALVSFLGKFEENEYGLDWFDGWMKRMSSNKRVIEYYPPAKIPGKDSPEKILVNDLDLLELVATDAGFTLSELDQSLGWFFQPMHADFAVKYFTLLALAGEDFDAYIKHAFKDIRKYLKIIKLGKGISKAIVQDDLIRRLTNLETTLNVLHSMHNRKFKITLPSGDVTIRTDLHVLRDLFYAVLQATPENKWKNYERDVNSLSVIVEIAKLGIFRNMGPKLHVLENGRYISLNTRGFLSLFRSLAKNPDLSSNILHKIVSSSQFVEAVIKNAFDRSSGDRGVFDGLSANAYDIVDELYRTSLRSDHEKCYQSFLSSMNMYMKDVGTIDQYAAITGSIFESLSNQWLTKLLLALKSDRDVYRDLPQSLYTVSNKALSLAASNNSAEAARLISLYLIKDPGGNLKLLSDHMQVLWDDRNFRVELDAALDIINDRFVGWILNDGIKSELSSRIWLFAGLSLLDESIPGLIRFVANESGSTAFIGYSDSFYSNTYFLSDPKYTDALINFMTVVRLGVQDIFSSNQFSLIRTH